MFDTCIMKTMSSLKTIFTYFPGQDSNCTRGAGEAVVKLIGV